MITWANCIRGALVAGVTAAGSVGAHFGFGTDVQTDTNIHSSTSAHLRQTTDDLRGELDARAHAAAEAKARLEAETEARASAAADAAADAAAKARAKVEGELENPQVPPAPQPEPCECPDVPDVDVDVPPPEQDDGPDITIDISANGDVQSDLGLDANGETGSGSVESMVNFGLDAAGSLQGHVGIGQ